MNNAIDVSFILECNLPDLKVRPTYGRAPKQKRGGPDSPPLLATGSSTGPTVLRERRPGEFDAFLRFLHGIGALRNRVLELDRRGERPLVLLHELQDFLDLSVAGSERHRLRAVDRQRAVLQVEAGNAI